jgi:phage shock protein A
MTPDSDAPLETMWAGKAQSMADKARALPEGSPERLKLEGLIRQALAEQTRYADVAAELNKAVSESKPMYDESIKLLEQIGYTKDEILSQRQRLDIARANAETKKAFAEAKRGGGDFQAQKLLDEAREKVGEIQAKAEAADQIASHLPPDASQVDAEVASITRNDRVDEEFNKLMGNPQ